MEGAESPKSPRLASELSERELLRRAMVNTMRLFSAEQLGSDANLFRETVMQTLEIVRQRQGDQGLEIGACAFAPSFFTVFATSCERHHCGCVIRQSYVLIFLTVPASAVGSAAVSCCVRENAAIVG